MLNKKEKIKANNKSKYNKLMMQKARVSKVSKL
jgi:hypothetical protein